MSDLAVAKRGADSTVPSPTPAKKEGISRIERALEQGLEESMAGSDTPSVLQPGKKFIGSRD
ncbi:MAG: hypothetical protein C5B56_14765 [Proteobacteria bacterium]|nr:MAG: hypothetical protein C5B56_14765 [Pseudomonadota bacterium]